MSRDRPGTGRRGSAFALGGGYGWGSSALGPGSAPPQGAERFFCLATACRDRISNLPALVSGQAAAAATAAFVRRRFRRRRSPLGASTSSIERERTAQIGKRWPCDGSRSASHLARLGLHPVFFARSGGVRDRASPGHHVRVQGIASPERRMQIVCLLTNLPTRAK